MPDYTCTITLYHLYVKYTMWIMYTVEFDAIYVSVNMLLKY